MRVLEFYLKHLVAQDKVDEQAVTYSTLMQSMELQGNISDISLYILTITDLDSGNIAQAINRYENIYPAITNSESFVVNNLNMDNAIDFGWLLLKDGQKQRANRLLDNVEQFINTIPRSGWFGSWMLDVRIAVLRGEYDKALQTLQQTVTEGWLGDRQTFLFKTPYS